MSLTMKFVICIFLLAVVAISLGDKLHYDINNAPALFEKFIKDFNKNYKDQADRDVHYQEFVKSLELINKANAENPHTVLDITQFADYIEEQQSKMGVLWLPEATPRPPKIDSSKLWL